jgi:exonuclease SbcD
VQLETQEDINARILEALPPPEQLNDAIVRLTIEYPLEWEAIIDEAALREHTAAAFEFHLIKRPQRETRIRLPDDQLAGSLTPLELLDIYWRARHTDSDERQVLTQLAKDIIEDVQIEQELLTNTRF